MWRIHRRIGMSGGLFTNMLARETGLVLTPEQMQRLRDLHAAEYLARSASIRPLPGARDVLGHLRKIGLKWAIATSGRLEVAGPQVGAFGVDSDRSIVVTRDQVRFAKPDPDLFLEAARRLGVPIESCVVVGDSVWDMLAARRGRALGVGLLSGGYGQEELERAGAARVYDDPADLLLHIDEVGGRV